MNDRKLGMTSIQRANPCSFLGPSVRKHDDNGRKTVSCASYVLGKNPSMLAFEGVIYRF
jgi:hypothetical protein